MFPYNTMMSAQIPRHRQSVLFLAHSSRSAPRFTLVAMAIWFIYPAGSKWLTSGGLVAPPSRLLLIGGVALLQQTSVMSEAKLLEAKKRKSAKLSYSKLILQS
jgi:hypothetical protein